MSGTLLDMISAMFVSVVPAALDTDPRIVSDLLWPGASDPTLQLRVEELKLPSPLAELKVKPLGKVSRTTMLLAVLGELDALVTVSRQVAVPPWIGGDPTSPLVSDRSA